MVAYVTFPDFYNEVRDAIEEHINFALALGRHNLEVRLRTLIKAELLSSPETRSMLSGLLKADFGFAQGEDYVIPVIDWIVERIFVRAQKWSFRSRRGYDIELAVFDVGEITSLPAASYLSDVNIPTQIEWLDWLLTKGSKIIIRSYEVSYQKHNHSRSGMAIMKKGKGWQVPSQYAGTERDNWITRVIEPLEDTILYIIEDEFEKYV
jgi:hypothetical protein